MLEGKTEVVPQIHFNNKTLEVPQIHFNNKVLEDPVYSVQWSLFFNKTFTTLFRVGITDLLTRHR